jgi:hypothetical protein
MVKESMLQGEKGAWAAHNLFGKILNGPPSSHIYKKTNTQTLEASEPLGISPRLALLSCPTHPCWPTRKSSFRIRSHHLAYNAEFAGTQNPLPKPYHWLTDRPSELIYRIWNFDVNVFVLLVLFSQLLVIKFSMPYICV